MRCLGRWVSMAGAKADGGQDKDKEYAILKKELQVVESGIRMSLKQDLRGPSWAQDYVTSYKKLMEFPNAEPKGTVRMPLFMEDVCRVIFI